jgi:hypothetical protein
LANLHTKGPIEVVGLRLFAVRGGKRELIGSAAELACTGNGDDLDAQRASDEETANVRLWAAAPELLAALQAIHEQLESPARNTHIGTPYGSSVTISEDVKKQVREVISKATGVSA